MPLPETVLAKLQTLPSHPGVYVFRDGSGQVLYVGKARSLRARVRSYFQPAGSDGRSFVARLETELGDIETFVTDTEKEAALLENQLIKEHRPRYNVKLRDDKDFLSLRLDTRADWPRLEVVRRPRPDGALYFGPYDSATSARQTLRLVNRHFQLRTCTDLEFKGRTRPCLQYQIKRCPGPCVRTIDRSIYSQQVRSVALFLDGRHDELLDELRQRMHDAAEALEYEKAASIRDRIRAVERVRQAQRVATVRDVDQDVFGLYRRADQAEVAVLIVRGGKLIGVRTYDLKNVSLPDDELLASFLAQWYARAPIPQEVLLPREVEAMEGLAAALGEQRRAQGKRAAPKVRVPRRGAGRRLLQMAMDNATHAFREKRLAEADLETRLAQIRDRLRLDTLPRRIECVDVSHIGGEDPVAVIVRLRDGVADRAGYRSYRIKRARGGDDYGAMYEVLSRRFRRGRDGEKGWELPDLLVVDGGKGQLNVALAALEALGAPPVAVVGLAKEKETPLGDRRVDRIYLPGMKNAIPIGTVPALQMLAYARDEAHRASNAFRIQLGLKRRMRSELDEVKGVGPKTRAKLLRAFGSTSAVREASEEELVAAGATRPQARAIRKALGVDPVNGNELGEPRRDAEAQALDDGFADAEVPRPPP